MSDRPIQELLLPLYSQLVESAGRRREVAEVYSRQAELELKAAAAIRDVLAPLGVNVPTTPVSTSTPPPPPTYQPTKNTIYAYVLDYIKAQGGKARSKNIVSHIIKAKGSSPGATRQALVVLMRKGVLTKVSRGLYKLV